MDLSRMQLLDGLSTDEATRIVALGHTVRLTTGAALFRLGDHADRLFVVASGEIALTMPVRIDGCTAEIPVEERTCGEVVGWSALIPPYRYTLHARAGCDSDLLAIPRTALLMHLSAEPRVGGLVMHNVARVVGQRLQVFQAMWLREMEQVIALRAPSRRRLS